MEVNLQTAVCGCMVRDVKFSQQSFVAACTAVLRSKTVSEHV